MFKHKKILLFCPPFKGHFNVLKTVIERHKETCHFKMVITGWDNVPFDTSSLPVEVVTLSKSELHETDPCLWTFQRMNDLLQESLTITEDFKPDLIIYDFFSLEGHFSGKILEVPVVCSIPAMIGPFTSFEYLNQKLTEESNQLAIKQLQEKFKISFEKMEMISDGFHIPGDINLIWSYQSVTPPDFMTGRINKPYIFIGNLSPIIPKVTAAPHKRIYFSLGTVVMDNLWNQQKETQVHLKNVINELALLWAHKPWEVLFVSQGKQVLEITPKNWTVVTNANQMEALSQADVFITHGGSNSFHEAVIQKVPMVVIPFFGDQPLVGKVVEDLGIGINANKEQGIDTRSPKNFLTKEFAYKVDGLVEKVLSSENYEQAYNDLQLDADSIVPIIEGRIPFKEGDLLYGTNIARHTYVKETNSQNEFGISKFRPFTELAHHSHSLPRIVDIYHDVILDSEFYLIDINSPLEVYKEYLNEYKTFLNGETDLGNMCIKGIDFFTKDHTIHFILEDYEPDKNFITTREIKYILDNRNILAGKVIFYKKRAGIWTTVTMDDVYKLIYS